MRKDIHPKYKEVSVTCNCGFQFVTRSAVGKDKLLLEVCSNCHPFYTGTQKLVDTAGRVDKFRQKYAKAAKPKKEAGATETKETPKEKPKISAKEKSKKTKETKEKAK